MRLANFILPGESLPKFGVQMRLGNSTYLLDVERAVPLLMPALLKPPRFEVGPYDDGGEWEERKAVLKRLLGLAHDALADKHAIEQWTEQGILVSENTVSFLPPVLRPGNLIGIGSNYLSQINEKKGRTDQPGVTAEQFSFPNAAAALPSSLTGHGQPVPYPARTQQLDYEGELAIVIGKRCRNVRAEDAATVIAGYTICNDISLRDLMKIEMKRGTCLFGKSSESTMPAGPYLVTADEIQDAQNLTIKTWVNGELRQEDNTGNVKYSIGAIVEYFSKITLNPGDMILTGTPGGSGINRDKPEDFLLKVGDVVEVEIEKLGRLRNHIIKE